MCINQTTKEDETRSLFVEKEILTLTLCINSPTYNIVVLMVARDTPAFSEKSKILLIFVNFNYGSYITDGVKINITNLKLKF